MKGLVDFYATQVRLLWEWRGGRLALLKRLVITLAVATLSFALTAALLPGLSVASLSAAALAVILIALFNALVRPLALAFIAPRSLILTGIAVLVLQVAAFLVVERWSPGVSVSSTITAIVASFVYAIINTTLTAILGVDRGGSYFGYLVQALRAKGAAPATDRPGVVIFQIDGLAYPILAARVRAGSVNTMASWIRNGTHRLSRWEAQLPSMTSASQLGILHGNNDGIPAFRWFEQPRRRRRDGPSGFERRGAAVQRRRQYLQPRHRRRYTLIRHDGRPRRRLSRPRGQPRVPALLLQPDGLPALAHAVPR